MNGFISENEKLIKTAMGSKKEEAKARWQIQQKLPNKQEMMDKGFANFTPIKDAVLPRHKITKAKSPQRIQVEDHEYAAAALRKTHSVEGHYPETQPDGVVGKWKSAIKKIQQVNHQSDPHLHKNKQTDKYLVETPNLDNYRGFLKVTAPDVKVDDHEILGGFDDESRGAQLRKIYEDDGVSEEEGDFDDEKSSVDFEEKLRSEIVTMVRDKVDSLEKKVRMFIEDHSVGCKKDFQSYETYFKDSVNKMNAYISEVHDGHIKEIIAFKKEKDDQVIINNMLVKKIQKLEKAIQSQQAFNDQFQTLGMIVETFMKIFAACE